MEISNGRYHRKNEFSQYWNCAIQPITSVFHFIIEMHPHTGHLHETEKVREIEKFYTSLIVQLDKAFGFFFYLIAWIWSLNSGFSAKSAINADVPCECATTYNFD